MIGSLISRLIILVVGNLYPAYASYKAVRNRDVKEYVKWMMYWIVFAFFTCIETCTDIFLSWLPFYYVFKALTVFWLLSPATKGSSRLYRKFVHPELMNREQEIDEYIHRAKERGYSSIVQMGLKGCNYATNLIMHKAIKALQYRLNAVNRRGTPMLTISQYQGVMNQRSNSLDAVSAMNMVFSGDGQIEISPYINGLCKDGYSAVRMREVPPRTFKGTIDLGSAAEQKQKVAKFD